MDAVVRDAMQEFGVSPGDRARVRANLNLVTLLSGDQIEFPATGVTVIVGANNAGKSTFLRHLDMYLQSGLSQLHSIEPRLIDQASVRREVRAGDLIDWLATHAAFKETSDFSRGYFSTPGQSFSLHSVLSNEFDGGHWDSLQNVYALLVRYVDAASRLQEPFSSQGRSTVDEAASTTLHRFQDDRSLFDELNRMALNVFGQPLLLDQYPGAVVQIRVGQVNEPVPPRDEPLGAFGRAVAKLPPLAQQGDGMRSFFALMLPVVAEARRVLLIDEPEAFLHPPQARALGHELGGTSRSRELQIVVATHDKDFIAGLIGSGVDLTVVRLVRGEDSTRAHQISSDHLREVWDDRTLRYSNVLNGLFSRLVVICESEQDCRFYEAALEEYVERHADDAEMHTLPVSDVLFIPSNGKSGFTTLIGVLERLAVPTVVIADLDLLRSKVDVRTLFERVGGKWESLDREFTVATAPLVRPSARRTAGSVLNAVTAILNAEIAKDPSVTYSPAMREAIDAHLAPATDPWAPAKRSGKHAFHGDARTALESVIDMLDRYGICLVDVGELEGFAPNLAKNKEWLPQAISQGAHQSSEAQALIGRVLRAHEALSGRGSSLEQL